MNILIVGANGLLGRHLADALEARGHRVFRCARAATVMSHEGELPRRLWIAGDFSQDTAVADWLPRVQGMDAVVNTAGIFHEQGASTFDAVHIRGPAALFEACAATGIHRAVHVSAVGADAEAASPYHLSKYQGDEAVLRVHPGVKVAQPSLIYAPDGPSSRLFLAMAALPLIPVPSGTQWVQPVHLEDAVAALVALTEGLGYEGQRVPLVGPKPISWRGYLEALRYGMSLHTARFMPVPHAIVGIAAGLGGLVRSPLLDTHSWRMLQRGNTADAGDIIHLLGRPPRTPPAFVPNGKQTCEAPRTRAHLDALLPMLRLLLACVWLVTAVVSLGVYPVQDSLAMLARVGFEGDLARLMLVGASGFDFALGIATLAWPRRRLWWAQMALIAFYTVVISIWLPEQWAHPFGPVLKNLPIIGVLIVLLTFEERR